MSRETTIQVRVSHEEKARIKKNAEDFGLSPSDYLRSQGLYSRPDAPVPYETQQDKANKAKVRKAVENDPSNLNVTLDDQGALVAKEVGKPMAYESPPEEVEVPISRDMWIASTARILMMEKGLSKVAATMQATKEWEATND